MKRFFFIVLSLVLALFIGCDNTTESPTGILSVSIATSKGVDAPVSMETASYKVVLNGPGGESEELALTASNPYSGAIKVAAGSWNIEVTAYNKDSIAIGSGSTTVTIAPDEIKNVSVTVAEYEGEGTFEVLLGGDVKETDVFRLEVFTEAETVVTEDLTWNGSSFQKSVSLKNGMYGFRIYKEGVASPLRNDSVRIVNGYTTTVSLTYDESGNLAIEIENEITATPKAEISYNTSDLYKDNPVELRADLTKANGFTVQRWLVNGTEVAGAEESITYTFTTEGVYEVVCYLYNQERNQIWAVRKVIDVPLESVRPTEITVSGDIIVWFENNVLLPYDYTVTINPFGGISGIRYVNGSEYSVIGQKAISCSLDPRYPDFYYYLESDFDEENNITNVYIIVDKEIDNPAYVNFSFEQELDLNPNTDGVFVWFSATDNILFPECTENYYRTGLLSASNRRGERKVKVLPDTYSFSGSSVFGNAWNPVVSIEKFTLDEGQSIDVTVTNEPFSTLVFQGLEQDVCYIIESPRYNWGNTNYADENGEIRVLYFGKEDPLSINIVSRQRNNESLPSSYYQCTVNPVMGEEIICNLIPVKINYIETDIEVPSERLFFMYDSKVVLPSTGFANLIYSLSDVSGVVDRWGLIGINGYNMKNISVRQNSKLSYALVCLEGYDVNLTAEQISDSEGPLTLVTIHVDKDIQDYSVLDITYDFPFDLDYTHGTGVSLSSAGSKIGYIPIGQILSTSVKIEKGSYSYYGYWNQIQYNGKQYVPRITPSSFTVSGDPVAITISLEER